MSSKNEQDEVDFSLKLDDDLLAAAVQAVEKRMEQGRQREADDKELEGETAEDVAVFFDENAEGSIELSVDLDTVDLGEDEPGEDELGDEPEPAPDAELAFETDQGLAVQELRAELELLNEELAAERERTDQARQDALRARKAVAGLRKEKEQLDEQSRRGRDITLKQGQKLKRVIEELGRTKLRLEDSETKVREWERLLAEARSALRQGEQDRERTRTRHTRELQEARNFASERSFKELLPVLDHMDLALAHADQDPARLVEGIQMILAQLVGTLKRQGLEKVAPQLGEPFDPAIHEAMKHVEDEQVAAGGVLELLQPGYVLHDRLLRPARVSVSSGPSVDEAEVPVDEDTSPAEAASSEE